MGGQDTSTEQALHASLIARQAADLRDTVRALPPSRARSLAETKLDEADYWLSRAVKAGGPSDARLSG